MYILDSNILIYLLRGEKKVKHILDKMGVLKFGISIVSRLEVLIGAEKQQFSFQDIENYLNCFDNFVLDEVIVNEAVKLFRKLKNKLKFKDLVIAATVSFTGSVLVTADKDFKKIPGLRVQMLRL